jgi:hypothetical protein
VIEEVRFFLRTGLFALVVSIVYWFVSYEVAGTFMLAFIVVAVLLFIAPIATMAQVARRAQAASESSALRRAVGTVDRVLGFDERPPMDSRALEIDEEPAVASSMWPLAGALAGALIGLGLVYGAWFWIPGLAAAAAVAWGWANQLTG